MGAWEGIWIATWMNEVDGQMVGWMDECMRANE